MGKKLTNNPRAPKSLQESLQSIVTTRQSVQESLQSIATAGMVSKIQRRNNGLADMRKSFDGFYNMQEHVRKLTALHNVDIINVGIQKSLMPYTSQRLSNIIADVQKSFDGIYSMQKHVRKLTALPNIGIVNVGIQKSLMPYTSQRLSNIIADMRKSFDGFYSMQEHVRKLAALPNIGIINVGIQKSLMPYTSQLISNITADFQRPLLLSADVQKSLGCFANFRKSWDVFDIVHNLNKISADVQKLLWVADSTENISDVLADIRQNKKSHESHDNVNGNFAELSIFELIEESDDIPEYVKNPYRQAVSSLDIRNYDASAVMSRKAVELAVKMLGQTNSRKFYKVVENLENRGVITSDSNFLIRGMRSVGNDGAHEKTPRNHSHANKLLLCAGMFLINQFIIPSMDD